MYCCRHQRAGAQRREAARTVYHASIPLNGCLSFVYSAEPIPGRWPLLMTKAERTRKPIDGLHQGQTAVPVAWDRALCKARACGSARAHKSHTIASLSVVQKFPPQRKKSAAAVRDEGISYPPVFKVRSCVFGCMLHDIFEKRLSIGGDEEKTR